MLADVLAPGSYSVGASCSGEVMVQALRQIKQLYWLLDVAFYTESAVSEHVFFCNHDWESEARRDFWNNPDASTINIG